MRLKPIALSVSPDEPCFGLFEAPMLVGNQWRWIQRIRVNRGDRMAYYETDFGPAEDFKDVTPLAMPSFGDDTVAQLQAHAEKNRHDDYWHKRSQEMLAESTLVQDHLQQAEMLLKVQANRSQLGPTVNVQRNEFPQQAVSRKVKDTRDDRRGYKTF